MNRRAFLSSTLAATGTGLGIALLSARSAPANTTGVIIAMPLNAKPGVPTSDVISAMRPFIEFIRSQKGLLEERLLAANFANDYLTHLHFMRWRQIGDWENLSADENFLKLFDNAADVFTLRPAEIFTQVET
jgi:hypothetical protein